jgi:hypothetical protein
MSYQTRNFVAWAVLMIAFALVAVYPTVSGFSSVSNLIGWLWVILMQGVAWTHMTENHTAEKGDDPAKRAKSIGLLRMVDAETVARSKFSRVVSDIGLAMLIILIAYTGSVFLALSYLFARFINSVADHTTRRTIKEADATTTPAAAQ